MLVLGDIAVGATRNAETEFSELDKLRLGLGLW